MLRRPPVAGQAHPLASALASARKNFQTHSAWADPEAARIGGHLLEGQSVRMGSKSSGADSIGVSVKVLDSRQKPLDGSRTYKLHLPPNPPVKDFWAVTMYDTQTRSQLQTDQQFPTLGSQDKGLKQNADGSYDIYFAPEAPAGQESNWLQTVPEKSWFIALRMYGPLQPWIDQTWRPGEIELVQ